MQTDIFAYSSDGIKGWFTVFNILKNLFYIAAAFLGFSLWFASTVNTPKTLAAVQTRLEVLSAAQYKLEGKVELSLEEIRLIKTMLKNERSYNVK